MKDLRERLTAVEKATIEEVQESFRFARRSLRDDEARALAIEAVQRVHELASPGRGETKDALFGRLSRIETITSAHLKHPYGDVQGLPPDDVVLAREAIEHLTAASTKDDYVDAVATLREILEAST